MMRVSAYISTTVAGIFAFIGAFYAWRFVLEYNKVDWKRYAAGRHLMSFTRGIAIILTYSVIAILARIVFGNSLWLVIVIDTGRIIIFGYVGLMMFVRYQLLEQATHTKETDHGNTE